MNRAPQLRKFGYFTIQEILVVTLPYIRLSVQHRVKCLTIKQVWEPVTWYCTSVETGYLLLLLRVATWSVYWLAQPSLGRHLDCYITIMCKPEIGQLWAYTVMGIVITTVFAENQVLQYSYAKRLSQRPAQPGLYEDCINNLFKYTTETFKVVVSMKLVWAKAAT